MFKSIFIMIFLFSFSYSNEDILNQNQTFFLPQQGNEAKDKIVELILTSKESIKISMYNFSYKKFAKELVEASTKGIKVELTLDKEKVYTYVDSKIPKNTKDLQLAAGALAGSIGGVGAATLLQMRRNRRR